MSSVVDRRAMRSKGSSKSGCRKLHVAAFYLELATVKKCLKAGDDPNGTRDLSMVDKNLPVDATPLSLVFIALLNEHILGGKKKLPPSRHALATDVARALLKAGADPSKAVADPQQENDKGLTPLEYAALGGCLPGVKLLLDRAPERALVRGGLGRQPYHVALEGGCAEVCDAFLARGQDVNAPRSESRVDAKGCVQFEASAVAGQSPTHLLCNFGTLGCLQYLVERRGLALDPPIGRWGAVPLHVCAINGRTATARYLLRRGCSREQLTARNFDGRTPADCARQYGDSATEAVLESHGLEQGDAVVCRNLSAGRFEGARAEILRPLAAGRFAVRVAGHERPVAIRPTNLVLAEAETAGPAWAQGIDGPGQSKEEKNCGKEVAERLSTAELATRLRAMGVRTEGKSRAALVALFGERWSPNNDARVPDRASRKAMKAEILGAAARCIDNTTGRASEEDHHIAQRGPRELANALERTRDHLRGVAAKEDLDAAFDAMHKTTFLAQCKALKKFQRAPFKRCAACGARPSGLRACARCQMVFYCSADCQKKDWDPTHKAVCGRLRQADVDHDARERFDWVVDGRFSVEPWTRPVAEVDGWDAYFEMCPHFDDGNPTGSIAFSSRDDEGERLTKALVRLTTDFFSYPFSIGAACARVGCLPRADARFVVDIVGGSNIRPTAHIEFQCLRKICVLLAGMFPDRGELLVRAVGPRLPKVMGNPSSLDDAPNAQSLGRRPLGREPVRVMPEISPPILAECHQADYVSFRAANGTAPDVVVFFHPGVRETIATQHEYRGILSKLYDGTLPTRALLITEFDDDDHAKLEAYASEVLRFVKAPRLEKVATGANPFASQSIRQTLYDVNGVTQNNGVWIVYRTRPAESPP